mmetsp:Transcript_26409/g.41284  ORF Transcript_26409/g.41284 Transcript_26409/m.41284 type:complete len:165 (+) Transcript_26409:984-1478(+)
MALNHAAQSLSTPAPQTPAPVPESYLSHLSPARFLSTSGSKAPEKAFVEEKIGRKTRSLAGKDEPKPPGQRVLGGARLPRVPWGDSDPNSLPPLSPSAPQPLRPSPPRIDEDLEAELDDLFQELGVERGQALAEALRPRLECPMPAFEPAVGGMLDEPVLNPNP